MASGMKIVQCASCNCGIVVGSTTRKPRHCKDCRIRRYVDNLESIMLKSGEPYERLLKAQREARQRRVGGGGPENNSSKPDRLV
jgi:hypothetical protein